MANIKDFPIGTPPGFVYLWSKANRYLEIGPKAYRESDFFKMPSADWPSSMLDTVRHGMEQICSFHGFSKDTPFEGLGIDGFYALLSTLHFEMEQQMLVSEVDTASFLDKMQMKHRVSGQQIVLYNRVPKPVHE
jgi:hypothetical protein